MKVTSYFPEIFVRDIDKAVASYVNDLGFTVKHRHENGESKYIILKNEFGDRVALITFPDDSIPEGVYAMRMNVRDINKCIEYFLVRGYRNPGSVRRGGKQDIHGHARYETMVSPEGVLVDIVEHLRDSDD